MVEVCLVLAPAGFPLSLNLRLHVYGVERSVASH